MAYSKNFSILHTSREEILKLKFVRIDTREMIKDDHFYCHVIHSVSQKSYRLKSSDSAARSNLNVLTLIRAHSKVFWRNELQLICNACKKILHNNVLGILGLIRELKPSNSDVRHRHLTSKRGLF